MPLKIWGRLSSVNVQKAMFCVQELRLPHERIDAGLAFGIVNTPEFRARNPNGLVPVIEDDGFVLWESNAIVRYLAAKHAAGSLSPNDLRQRADADRWMDWQTTTLQPAMGPAFIHLVRLPPEKHHGSGARRPSLHRRRSSDDRRYRARPCHPSLASSALGAHRQSECRALVWGDHASARGATSADLADKLRGRPARLRTARLRTAIPGTARLAALSLVLVGRWSVSACG
jgi:glutathione S-transferase